MRWVWYELYVTSVVHVQGQLEDMTNLNLCEWCGVFADVSGCPGTVVQWHCQQWYPHELDMCRDHSLPDIGSSVLKFWFNLLW